MLVKDWSGSRNSSSCDFEDFVMVPAHFSGKDPVLSGLRARPVPLTERASVAAADLTADGPEDGLTTSG